MAEKIKMCPLMSKIGDIAICRQEECSWYLKNYKVCSVYMLAYNASLDVKAKQPKKD